MASKFVLVLYDVTGFASAYLNLDRKACVP
jgi:hypothetical protein